MNVNCATRPSHSGESPTSVICVKALFPASDLKKHVAVHIGEKCHHCEMCNKPF